MQLAESAPQPAVVASLAVLHRVQVDDVRSVQALKTIGVEPRHPLAQAHVEQERPGAAVGLGRVERERC
jgi:hypothetical protein